jgi:hypothetical protein
VCFQQKNIKDKFIKEYDNRKLELKDEQADKQMGSASCISAKKLTTISTLQLIDSFDA